MKNLREYFKEILIMSLIILLFLTNGLWCVVHTTFIHGYFWSDYNVINSNENTNENKNNN